jgi:hypothetical protein
MNRHDTAMALIWLDVAWGGPTRHHVMGGMGGWGVWGVLWLAIWWLRCVRGKMSKAPHDRHLWALDQTVRNSPMLH